MAVLTGRHVVFNAAAGAGWCFHIQSISWRLPKFSFVESGQPRFGMGEAAKNQSRMSQQASKAFLNRGEHHF